MEEEDKKLIDTLAGAQKVMNEADVPEDFGALQSPLESEKTAEKDQVDMVKPVKVRLIDYPPRFKSQFVKGKSFQVNGEVFEVYDVKDPKNGRPRFLVRGIGIIGIVEEGKGAENG